MVGVVGSSPIAPTNRFESSRSRRSIDEKAMVMTPRTRTETLLAKARVRTSVVYRRSDEKVRLRPHFFAFVESRQWPAITLPDGSVKQFDAPGHRRRRRRLDRPRPRQGRARRQGRRQARRHVASHRPRRDARDRHRQGRRGPRRHPPFDGAPARLRGEGALPRRAGDDRPGDRERLLLRLLVQAPLHARGPRRDREAHGRAREARTSPSRARRCRATTR